MVSNYDLFADLLGDLDSSPAQARKPDPAILPYELDEQGMARLCALSLSMVRTKAREKVFVRSSMGKYDVEKSVQNYITWLRESATKNAPTAASRNLAMEKLRVTKEQADKLEIQNAALRGDMVPVAEVRREWVQITTDLRGSILAIPSRVSARMGLDRESSVALEDEIRLALKELTDE